MMNNPRKVKFLLSLATIALVALFAVVCFQLTNIIKIKNKMASQENTIQQLEQTIDYYKDKIPNNNHDEITQRR